MHCEGVHGIPKCVASFNFMSTWHQQLVWTCMTTPHVMMHALNLPVVLHVTAIVSFWLLAPCGKCSCCYKMLQLPPEGTCYVGFARSVCGTHVLRRIDLFPTTMRGNSAGFRFVWEALRLFIIIKLFKYLLGHMLSSGHMFHA